jgi:hypothetical protein
MITNYMNMSKNNMTVSKFMLKNMNLDIGIREQFEKLKVETNHHRNKIL